MCKTHCLIIISTLLFTGASFARSSQDFMAAKAECMSMAGNVGTPQIENNRVSAYNRGFVNGINTFNDIKASNDRSEIYNDCLRGKGWTADGTDINTSNKSVVTSGGSAADNNNNVVIDEINNIPELYSWRKFDSNKFQVAIDIDNELRSKKGWQAVSLHNRFLRVVDVTNAIYGDTPSNDEKCIANDKAASVKGNSYQLAALRMYPPDMVKNYNFMCQNGSNKQSYNHFLGDVRSKENLIANIQSVKSINARPASQTADDF